jgi:2-deoxy-D-gluconate 3-dehydrogenase
MTNVLDSFRLDNKIALVTGSASGLGAAIATALAQAGATVACHGNQRHSRLICRRLQVLNICFSR